MGLSGMVSPSTLSPPVFPFSLNLHEIFTTVSSRCLFSYSPSSFFNCVLTVRRLSFLWIMTKFCLWVFCFSTKDGILVGKAIWVHMVVSFNQLKPIKNNI
jgi:hypothetical protein